MHARHADDICVAGGQLRKLAACLFQQTARSLDLAGGGLCGRPLRGVHVRAYAIAAAPTKDASTSLPVLAST